MRIRIPGNIDLRSVPELRDIARSGQLAKRPKAYNEALPLAKVFADEL